MTLALLSQIQHVSWLMLHPCSSAVFAWVCMQEAADHDFHNRLLASLLHHYPVSRVFHMPNTAIWLVAPDFWCCHTNTKSTQTIPGPLPFLKEGEGPVVRLSFWGHNDIIFWQTKLMWKSGKFPYVIMPRCACANKAYCNWHVCLCVCLSALFPLRRANAEAGKCLYQYRAILARFRILNQGLVCELWRDLLTLTPIARDPESSEDQTLHSRLLFNYTVTSMPRARHNTSENMKTRQLKASCHLPVRHSAAAIEGVAA